MDALVILGSPQHGNNFRGRGLQAVAQVLQIGQQLGINVPSVTLQDIDAEVQE